jgi:CRP-like cAMP-binding protein
METLFESMRQICEIEDDALEDLKSVLHRKDLPKNSYLITEGKICDHLYFIKSGSARGFYNLDGKEVTYWFCFETGFITSLYSFVSRKPCIENIQLMEDSVLFAISYADLQALYNRQPSIERFGRIMNEQYYVRLEERLILNHQKEARERYENLMTNSPQVLQRVPLGYVASYLGMSQETLSRIRSKH